MLRGITIRLGSVATLFCLSVLLAACGAQGTNLDTKSAKPTELALSLATSSVICSTQSGNIFHCYTMDSHTPVKKPEMGMVMPKSMYMDMQDQYSSIDMIVVGGVRLFLYQTSLGPVIRIEESVPNVVFYKTPFRYKNSVIAIVGKKLQATSATANN